MKTLIWLSINKQDLHKLFSYEVNHEMYLTNRTLPKYLNVRYLSESFGTGRYFLTYENINLQNNLFNLFNWHGLCHIIILYNFIFFAY